MKKLSLVISPIALFFFVSSVLAHSGSILLQTHETKIPIGSTTTVAIMVDNSHHEVVGTDFSFTYDPHYLELTAIEEGKLFDTYTNKTIDNKDGKGSISGLVTPGKTVKGTGKFATLTFKALKEGKSPVAVVFEKDSRNDSNMASLDGEDVLDSVQNVEYQIVGKGYTESFIEKLRRILEKLRIHIK